MAEADDDGPNEGRPNGGDVDAAPTEEAVAQALLRISDELERLRGRLGGLGGGGGPGGSGPGGEKTQGGGTPPPPTRDPGVQVTRKLAIFSDGTGNSSAKAEKTNVWRLFEALDQTDPNQLAYYDDGVGTSRYKYVALLGGAFGWGLKRNVIDLYKFVCRNYRHGDKIYCFGFSRGAFTIRMLVGLIDHIGLIENAASEQELDRLANQNYKEFRRKCFMVWPASPVKLYRWLEDRLHGIARLWRRDPDRANNVKPIPIEFLGLWDTVGAYGMPIAELQPAVEWLCWPMRFHNTRLSKHVQRCCHALSLDDERTTFHPIVFEENDDDDQRRISQVWFAGVHSNVGGGYPEDRLSLVSLHWMLRELQNVPEPKSRLKFRDGCVEGIAAERSVFGRLYDSRAGTGILYRYSPREVLIPSSTGRMIKPIIDASVIERMALGGDGYAPSTLPDCFRIRTSDGSVLKMEDMLAQTSKDVDHNARAVRKTLAKLCAPRRGFANRVLDLIWLRHKAYFVSMMFMSALVLFPLYGDALHAALGGETFDHLDKLVSGLLVPSMMQDSLSVFVPGELALWVDAAASQPLEFLFFALMWLGSMRWSAALRARLHDLKALAWLPYRPGVRHAMRMTLSERAARVFRSIPLIPAVSSSLIRHAVPLSFIAVVFFALAAGASRLTFETASVAGVYCKGSATGDMGAGPVTIDRPFETSSACWSSGQVLQPGTMYRVVLDAGDSQWADENRKTSPAGFEVDSLASVYLAGTPFKRFVTVPWFRPVARIGSKGDEEYLFQPCMASGGRKVMAEFIPRRKGELFLFVNDAVLFGSTGRYANNTGTASVTITPVTQGTETTGCVVRPKS